MAIALVASVTVAPGSGGGTTAAVDTTGATLLVISASWYTGGAGGTPSDSKGNTWTPLTPHTQGTTRHAFFYALTPTVGTGHTFSFTGTNIYPAILASAFSAVATYQTESGAGSGASPLASGSVTPSAAGALVLTGRVANAAATDAITPAGFTLTQVNFSGGTTMQGSVGYDVQAVAAAINPTWSWTGGTPTENAVSTAVFLPGAAPLAEGRVSQLVAETITYAGVPAITAATQLVVETLTATPVVVGYARLSQAPVEILDQSSVAAGVVSQAPVETVQQFAPALVFAQVSQAPVEILYPFGCYARPRPPAAPVRRAIRRLRRAPHVQQAHRRIAYARFALDLQRGVGLPTGQGADPLVTLRLSRDGGQTWGEPVPMRAGKLGAYTTRVIARRLGQARDAVFEVTVSDPVAWALVQAWIDLEPGTS